MLVNALDKLFGPQNIFSQYLLAHKLFIF